MNANELYQSGKLTEAVEAAISDVKKRPTDLAARYTLAQLLCFTGDLERADTHLDAISTQEPERLVIVALFRQLIRGEQWRRQCFDEGRVPEFLAEPSPTLCAHLQAMIALREGKPVEAAELVRRALEERPNAAGTCNGETFDEFRDLDDRTASFFEVLTSNGKYYWIPTEKVERVEFRPPETLFDLVWRPAQMECRGGPDGEVYIPALYHGTYRESDDAMRLGRATDWRGEEENVIRGVGQRILLAGERDLSIMEINEITFNEVGG
jgi:type VI secretion system protein ImpE